MSIELNSTVIYIENNSLNNSLFLKSDVEIFLIWLVICLNLQVYIRTLNSFIY